MCITTYTYRIAQHLRPIGIVWRVLRPPRPPRIGWYAMASVHSNTKGALQQGVARLVVETRVTAISRSCIDSLILLPLAITE